jgi:TPR repeat protein
MTPPAQTVPRRSVPLRATVRTVVMISLLLFVLLLRFCVYRLEQYVLYIQQQQQLDAATNQTQESSETSSSHPMDPSSNNSDTFSWDFGVRAPRHRRAPYHSISHMKEIYWNQVLDSGVMDFDLDAPDAAHSRRWESNSEGFFSAVQRAAEHGHALAQLLYANALMAGFWTTSTDNHKRRNETWRVSDTWWMVEDPNTRKQSAEASKEGPDHSVLQQQAQAMLLWKMAAISGNVDAMVTLGYRIEEQMSLPSPTPSPSSCLMALPYYAAAAHHTMDTLIQDVQYRGQMAPAQDRHILYKLHVHGNRPSSGSSSQDVDNRPDESREAVQFFKIKAASLLAQQQPAASSPRAKSSRAVDAAVTTAAYTLGRYYHTGLRGIPANLTLAVQYYTAAAQAGHWEAAGQAGLIHFWNLGARRTAGTGHREEAYRLFLLGAPHDLQGCQLRYQLKVAQSQQQKASSPAQDLIYLCDSESLNGLGLVHLFGLPSKNVSVNRPVASEYFELARDQGNANAAYHLAMMKLGWRTHYGIHTEANRTLESDSAVKDTVEFLNEDDGDIGMTVAASKAEQLFPFQTKESRAKDPQNHLTISEYKNIVTDLTTASKKGHIMARHRLAMIYETGIPLPSSSDESASSLNKQQVAQRLTPKFVVARDCTVATNHYKWILEYASPTLAKRMRRGYQHYMTGNYMDSLRNYLLVSETGHGIAQMNAAFLLEQGVCLGLNSVDCAKASVRLWKAVAKNGNAEASMRVGDFYYYGRFRDAKDRVRGESSIPVGPWGWIDYLIYPERHILPLLWNAIKRQIINFSVWEPLSILDLPSTKQKMSPPQNQENDEPTCNAETGSEDGSCPAVDMETSSKSRRLSSDIDEDLSRRRRQLDEDLAMAALYYQMAADRTGTARAHFNLGFMYEWGLGLKQDFPLAKRQYDLAISSLGYSQEADIPVSLALLSLSIHEYLVKLKLSWERYWSSDSENDQSPAPPVDA